MRTAPRSKLWDGRPLDQESAPWYREMGRTDRLQPIDDESLQGVKRNREPGLSGTTWRLINFQ